MIGIDISDKSIKVAEVEGSSEPRLRSIGWAAVEATAIRRGQIYDAQVVGQQLSQALARGSPVPIAGTDVVASIPEIQSFVRMVEVPIMSDKETDEAVRWSVRRHIPFDVDTVYLDWQPLSALPQKPTHRQVLVGAAQRAVVDGLLQVLDGFGFNVLALELEAQSIVRSLLPLDARDIRGVLIIDLGATSTNVVYFDQGIIRYTISVPSGGDFLTQELATKLSLSLEDADQKKALVGVSATAVEAETAAVLREATRRLLSQIEWSTRELTLQAAGSSGIKAILLAGGAANLPGISEVFAEVFPGVPTQMGNPWTNLLAEESKKGAPLSVSDASHFATALGLGLRRITYGALRRTT